MTTSSTPNRPIVVLLREGHGELEAATAATRLATGRRDIVVGAITDDHEAQAMLLAISRGSPVVVAANGAGPVWSRFVRAAGEIGRPCRWETSTLHGLTATQIELLWALAEGLHVPAAARAASVSERSAHRQLIAARALLGARTNSHAATIVRTGVAQLG
ncbi:MAG: hypothetical protein ACXWBN_20460 [Acidimicrobiales bacterium]